MRFGTAGVPNSSKDRSTVGGIRSIRELGLDAMEVQFVRGVKMGLDTAKQVKEVAESLNVKLSVHAPYYINLNADGEKLKGSIERLKKTVEIGGIFAEDIVFHPGYYLKHSKETAYRRIRDNLKLIVEFGRDRGVMLRPETTGKPTQFGDLEETLKLCQELEILPCIDFAHIHARYRAFNSYEEFCQILEIVENTIGSKALKKLHIHVSGIEYGLKGEKRHLNLRESDFRYEDLLRAFKDFKVDGTVIVESPNLEEDAKMLKMLWSQKSLK
ncbi:TIM barrel protein [Archaeoglobus sp.]